MAPSYAQKSCTWIIRNDIVDEGDHLIAPSFWVLRVCGVLAADDDEVVLVVEIRIVAFYGLIEGDFGIWCGAVDAFVVTLMDLLVEGGVGVEDDGDTDFEFDHGCGCDKVRGR